MNIKENRGQGKYFEKYLVDYLTELFPNVEIIHNNTFKVDIRMFFENYIFKIEVKSAKRYIPYVNKKDCCSGMRYNRIAFKGEDHEIPDILTFIIINDSIKIFFINIEDFRTLIRSRNLQDKGYYRIGIQDLEKLPKITNLKDYIENSIKIFSLKKEKIKVNN